MKKELFIIQLPLLREVKALFFSYHYQSLHNFPVTILQRQGLLAKP